MRWRRAAAMLACAWFAVGAWGAWSHTGDYITYRGFAPPTDPPGVHPGQVRRVSFWSAALHARRHYSIYIPPQPAGGRAPGRLPVLYLLHGSPGTPDLFLDVGAIGVAMDTLVERHTTPPFYIVMPDGRDGSLRSDTEWADTPHGAYDSFVIDVVHAVDRRWPTIQDRAHRAIAGNSEGAYAAVNLGLRHLGLFSIIESWSGYFTQTAAGPFRGAPPALLRANSPADYVAGLRPELRRQALHAFLYGGAQDKGTRELATFAQRLSSAGASVTAAVWHGRHDWKLWRERTPAMLRFAGHWFGAPA